MTLLACMAKGDAKIDPAVCVQEQVDERCFCPKAPIAISEVSTGTPDPRLKHQMPVLRARAEAMYRQPPDRRYAGPALSIHNARVQVSKDGGGTGPGALLVDSPAQRESPAVTSSVAPAVPATGLPIPATGCEAAKEGTIPAVEPVVTRPEVPSGVEPRICRIAGCGKELRSDNQSQLCGPHTLEARSISGSRRLGVPRVVFPSSTTPHVAKKETVVPIKPVEAHPLAQVLDSAGTFGGPVDQQLRQSADQAAHFHRDLREERPDQAAKFQRVLRDPAGVPLCDPTSLPHEYLIACVKEARRRLAALDEHFTFITAKEA